MFQKQETSYRRLGDRSMWHTGSSEDITLDTIMVEISSHTRKNGSIFIGCDSQIIQNGCTFSTVICLHGADGQAGGRYFFRREKRRREKFPTMLNRLLREVELSVEMGFRVTEEFPDADVEIHIDANAKKNEASGRFSDMLIGYARGAGFKCKIKPDAWASSSIADKHSK
jgi:predicted RNase H-related nuclease YkuK (DUF458 family)